MANDPYRPGQPVPQFPPPPAYPQAPGPYPAAPAGPTYPQPVAYPQPTYPQPAYPQPAYPQPAYPQQGYPQPTYPQPGYPQPPQGGYAPGPSYPAGPSYPQPMPQGPSYPQPSAYAQPGYGQAPQPVYPQAHQPATPIPLAAQQVVTPTIPNVAPVPVPAPATPVKQRAATPSPVRPSPQQAPQHPQSVARPSANAPVPANRPLPLGSRPIPAPQAAAGAAVIRKQDEQEEAEKKTVEKIAVKSAPPWMVSLVVHMVAIIALALCVFVLPHSNAIQLSIEPPDIWAEKLGEQIKDDMLQSPESLELDVKDPALSLDSKPVDDPFAAPPQVEIVNVLDANKATDDIVAPSIGLALSGREKGAKSALLAAYGGTKTTEEAVKAGLEWLKKNQRSDGSWSLTGPYSNAADVENVASATAMALLAFQGAGHTHKDGEFKDVVRKGWDAMLKMQNPDGDFVQQSALHQRLYAQAQATISVCEIYGMTKDEKFKKPAQLAVDFAHRAQAPEGGWRYEPKIDSDVSVTGWFVMALQSAQMAGLEVQSPAQEKISQYLDQCQSDDGGRYAYQPGKGETIVMTAEGLLCRQYLGWKHKDERLQRGCQYLLANRINYGDQNVYYWYYATQVLHHMDGKFWDDWNVVMRQVVPEHQIKTGGEKGSWPPSEDRWGIRAGRLYTTCLSIYMLEVYYRHMPLYKQRLQ